MRTCLSCGRSIENRRKDAVFCERAACRAKKYRERQTTTVSPAAQSHVHKAGAVLACACGRRYVLEISALDGADAPQVTPTHDASETVTQTVSPAAPPPPADSGHAPPAEDAKANSSKQIAATPPATPTSVRKADTPPAVRTVELYFTDEVGRRLPSSEAVINHEGRSWQIRGHARPAIAVVRDSGGRIGRWADYHAERSPSDLGFDRDIVVLCWDDQQQGVAVPAITLLQTALGREWKTKLRELCDGK